MATEDGYQIVLSFIPKKMQIKRPSTHEKCFCAYTCKFPTLGTLTSDYSSSVVGEGTLEFIEDTVILIELTQLGPARHI